jgi:multidrug efflux pump subunit AcrA (membrane-fusion protein)
MKLFKITATCLLAAVFALSLWGCGSGDEETGATPEFQTTAVQRGDIAIEITAAGNLALSRTEDLAVDLFYGQSGTSGTKGTIGEVLVEEGDTVEEGQVLVTIDREEWDDQMADLRDAVTAQERSLLTAQINLDTARQTLKTAQDNVAAKELAVLNAQISRDQAQTTLNTQITAVDFEATAAALDRAKEWYEYVLLRSGTVETAADYELALERAKEQLDIAQTNYDNALSGYNTTDINLKRKQLDAAERSLAAAEEDLLDVAEDVTIKEQSLKLKEGQLADAEKSLADTQADLEEALEKSPEIKAPFAGFITAVNVEGGDEVLNGTVAVTLADPEKFEADILVSEMDIMQVKLDGEAWVEIDAMSGLTLPATVTRISPTATISSGVVNYEVKVEVKSMEAVARDIQANRQQAMASLAEGEIPPPLQAAIDEGRLTREQVDEMMQQRQEMIEQGITPSGPPAGFGEGFAGAAADGAAGAAVERQTPMVAMEDFQLREGLTVTVTILIDEATGVLLVPNAAITATGMQSTVEVQLSSGQTETRTVQTGLSDWQFTEITDGLEEGELVLVPQGTATVATTSETRGGFMMFGGPPRR